MKDIIYKIILCSSLIFTIGCKEKTGVVEKTNKAVDKTIGKNNTTKQLYIVQKIKNKYTHKQIMTYKAYENTM